MPKTTVYSLADVRAVLYHQNVGQCVLSSQGMGKIAIAYSGDISSHTVRRGSCCVATMRTGESHTGTDFWSGSM